MEYQYARQNAERCVAMGEPTATKRAYSATVVISGKERTYKTFARSREQARMSIKKIIPNQGKIKSIKLTDADDIPPQETDACEIENLDELIEQVNVAGDEFNTSNESEIPEHTGLAKDDTSERQPGVEQENHKLQYEYEYDEYGASESTDDDRSVEPYWKDPEEHDETGDDHPDPDEVLRDNAEIYTEKNADYGQAWLLAAKTMELWGAELGVDEIPTDTESMAGMGLYWERLIKLIRAFNLEYSDTSPSNESTAESHSDASTYAAIQSSFVRGDRDE